MAKQLRKAELRYYERGHRGQPRDWAQSPDNPASPNFVDLERRGEYARARWWALRARRAKAPSSGEFDG